MLCFRFQSNRCWRKRQKSSRGRWENHLVQECAQGSPPDSTSHLFLLLSSSGRRNFKWCLYLCCSGSGEQRRVLMWVKNAPRRKSFHIPEWNGRCGALWLWELVFCCVILAWNTLFGHLKPCTISGLRFFPKPKYDKIFQRFFFFPGGKVISCREKTWRNNARLVSTAGVEVIALNSGADFPT